MGGRRFGGALGGEQVGGTVGGEGGGDDRHQRGRDAPAWDAAAVVAAGAAARHCRRDPPRTRDDSVLPGVFSMVGGLAQNVKNWSVRSQSREKSAWSPRAAARRGRASHQGGRGARRDRDPGPPPRSFPATVRSRRIQTPVPFPPALALAHLPFPSRPRAVLSRLPRAGRCAGGRHAQDARAAASGGTGAANGGGDTAGGGGKGNDGEGGGGGGDGNLSTCAFVKARHVLGEQHCMGATFSQPVDRPRCRPLPTAAPPLFPPLWSPLPLLCLGRVDPRARPPPTRPPCAGQTPARV